MPASVPNIGKLMEEEAGFDVFIAGLQGTITSALDTASIGYRIARCHMTHLTLCR
jgi:hypothetical protein